MVISPINNQNGDSSDYSGFIRSLESQFPDQGNATTSSASNTNQPTRQNGVNLAKNMPTEGISLSDSLNLILEKLQISETGQFEADTTDGLKFKVDQKYLKEQGFTVVQNNLLSLNKVIQEHSSLIENVLNYKIEIDPTRNVVKFNPSAEFKYAPEIINIKNIPLISSPNEGIFEGYPVNTLIPVLVGPPPLDYLRTISGEKTKMFSGIDNNSFDALEKAAKQEDPGKIDFHLAQALNIGMLPNGEMTIINDLQVLKQLKFSPDDFIRRLAPQGIIHPNDIHRLKKAENSTEPFHTTPFTPPPIRKILELLPTVIAPYDRDPGYEGYRFTMKRDLTPLAPQELQPLIESAGLIHYLQYITQHHNLLKDGIINKDHPVPKNLGFLIKPDGGCILPEKILNPQKN
jgi:hypothetical protein